MTNGRTPPPRVDAGEEPPEPAQADYTVAFSPRQVAGGFAILAALLLLVVRRRRGRAKKPA